MLLAPASHDSLDLRYWPCQAPAPSPRPQPPASGEGPPDHNWRFVDNWCVEENALTWPAVWRRPGMDLYSIAPGFESGAAIPDSLVFTANDVEPVDEIPRNRLYVGPPSARHESQKSRQDWLQNLAPEDDVPLEDLGLDPTLVSFLEGNDIRGVAQLVSRTEEELMAIRHLGSGKAAKIRAGLERFGWRLGDVSSFSEGRRRLHSALAEQSLEAESEQREANNGERKFGKQTDTGTGNENKRER